MERCGWVILTSGASVIRCVIDRCYSGWSPISAAKDVLKQTRSTSIPDFENLGAQSKSSWVRSGVDTCTKVMQAGFAPKMSNNIFANECNKLCNAFADGHRVIGTLRRGPSLQPSAYPTIWVKSCYDSSYGPINELPSDCTVHDDFVKGYAPGNSQAR